MTNEELAERIRQGGSDATECKEALYLQNTGILHKWIKPYLNHAEADDLMQVGYMGLIAAAEKYDPGQDAKFITYAFYHVRNAIIRYIFSGGGKCSVAFPSRANEKIMRFLQFKANYEKAHSGQQPTDAEMCAALNLSGQQLEQIKAAVREMYSVSIDGLLPGSDSVSYGEAIPDGRDQYAEVIENVANEENRRKLWECVEQLPDARQRTILIEHFREGRQLKDIGEDLNLTPAAAGYHEKKALRTLSRREDVKRIAADYEIEAMSWRGGFQRFKRTGSSCVEIAAIKRAAAVGRYAWMRRELQSMDKNSI